MRKKHLFAAVAAAGIAGAATPACAAVIELSFDFSASGFSGAGAPYDPVTGSLLFTFDNSADIASTTTGLTLDSFTLPASYTLRYAYNAANDVLVLSDAPTSGGCGASTGADKFCTFINDASTNPNMAFFYYGSASTRALHHASSLQFDASVTTPAVPEPTTWALMILGFFGLGYATRRERRKNVGVRFA